MADAPSTSPYIVYSPASTDLPFSKTLTSDINVANYQFQQSGSNIVLVPVLKQASLLEMDTAGFVNFNGTTSFTPRTLTTDGTIGIVNTTGTSGNPLFSVTPDTTTQRVGVSQSGSLISTRSNLNFIPGSNMNIVIDDNSGENRVDITFQPAVGIPSNASVVYTSTTAGNSQNLSYLTNGLMKVGISGNVATIATAIANADYLVPTSALLQIAPLTPQSGQLIVSSGNSWGILPPGSTGYVATMTSANTIGWAPIETPSSVFYASTAPGNSQNLGTLSTGLLKLNVASSIATASVAVANTDYVAPTAGLLELAALTPTSGQMIISSGNAWNALAAGTVGYVATITSANTIGWAPAASSANSTYLCQNATDLPTNGINVGATGAMLGVGLTSPAFPLDVFGSAVSGMNNVAINAVINSTTNTSSRIQLTSYKGTASTSTPAIFSCRTARGTSTSPAATQSGDAIGGLFVEGYGTGFSSLNLYDACILFSAQENFTYTNRGTSIEFVVTDIGSNVPNLAASILANGTASFNYLSKFLAGYEVVAGTATFDSGSNISMSSGSSMRLLSGSNISANSGANLNMNGTSILNIGDGTSIANFIVNSYSTSTFNSGSSETFRSGSTLTIASGASLIVNGSISLNGGFTVPTGETGTFASGSTLAANAGSTINLNAQINQTLTNTSFINATSDNSSTGAAGNIYFKNLSGTGINGALLFLGQSRGTTGAYVASNSGDTLGEIVGFGQTLGTTGSPSSTPTYANGSGIVFATTETWTASHAGSSIGFYVIPNTTTTPVRALLLNQDYSATFGGALYATSGGTLSGTWAGTSTFSGALSMASGSTNTYLSGSTSTYNSGSTLAFNNVPSFSGGLNVTGGSLAISSSGTGLSTTSASTVAFSGPFNLNGTSATKFMSGATAEFQSGSSLTIDSGASLVVNGTISLNAGFTVPSGESGVFVSGSSLIANGGSSVNLNSQINQTLTNSSFVNAIANNSSSGGGANISYTNLSGSGIDGSLMYLGQSRGTTGAYVSTNSGDTLGQIVGFGQTLGTTGTPSSTPTYANGSAVVFTASETWGATNAGSSIGFYVIPNTTTSPVRGLLIDQNSNLICGGALTAGYGGTLAGTFAGASTLSGSLTMATSSSLYLNSGAYLVGNGGSVIQLNSTAALNIGDGTSTATFTLNNPSTFSSVAGSFMSIGGSIDIGGALQFIPGSSAVLYTTFTASPGSAITFNTGSSLLSGGSNIFVSNVMIGTNATTTHTLEVFNDDAKKSTTTLWILTSDARIKTNVVDTEEALPIINALQPRKYKYTDEWIKSHEHVGLDGKNLPNPFEGEEFYGFIADEVMAVIPSCVTVTNDTVAEIPDLKVLNMHNMNILLFKAIKELSFQLEALKSEIDALKSDKSVIDSSK